MSEKNLRNDPLPAFCFKVKITVEKHKRAEAYFQSVTGLTYETDVDDFREGGLNHTTRRLVGAVKWPNLVLKKGFTGDPLDLLGWREEWAYQGKEQVMHRASGSVIQLNHKMQTVCEWQFERGWPCKWVGPDYDASKSELGIETLEIAHEGLTFKPRPPNS